MDIYDSDGTVVTQAKFNALLGQNESLKHRLEYMEKKIEVKLKNTQAELRDAAMAGMVSQVNNLAACRDTYAEVRDLLTKPVPNSDNQE